MSSSTFYDYWKVCTPEVGGLFVAITTAAADLITAVLFGLALIGGRCDILIGGCPAVWAGSTVLAATAGGILGAVDLVVGIALRKSIFLIPWLAIHALFIAFVMVLGILALVNNEATIEDDDGGTVFAKPGTSYFLGSIIVSGLLLYAWAAVFDLFLRFKADEFESVKIGSSLSLSEAGGGSGQRRRRRSSSSSPHKRPALTESKNVEENHPELISLDEDRERKKSSDQGKSS